MFSPACFQAALRGPCQPVCTAVCAGRQSPGPHSTARKTHFWGEMGLKLSLLLAVTPLRCPRFSTTNVENITFLQGRLGVPSHPHQNPEANLSNRKSTSQPKPSPVPEQMFPPAVNAGAQELPLTPVQIKSTPSPTAITLR